MDVEAPSPVAGLLRDLRAHLAWQREDNGAELMGMHRRAAPPFADPALEAVVLHGRRNLWPARCWERSTRSMGPRTAKMPMRRAAEALVRQAVEMEHA